jgi:hypothetical protein
VPHAAAAQGAQIGAPAERPRQPAADGPLQLPQTGGLTPQEAQKTLNMRCLMNGDMFGNVCWAGSFAFVAAVRALRVRYERLVRFIL